MDPFSDLNFYALSGMLISLNTSFFNVLTRVGLNHAPQSGSQARPGST